jgi:hypothetical protein
MACACCRRLFRFSRFLLLLLLFFFFLSAEEDGVDGVGNRRGSCGAGGPLGADGEGGLADLAVVKAQMRLLSLKLMEGDESVATNNEYAKWEAIMSSHPEYIAEQQADLQVASKLRIADVSKTPHVGRCR